MPSEVPTAEMGVDGDCSVLYKSLRVIVTANFHSPTTQVILLLTFLLKECDIFQNC